MVYKQPMPQLQDIQRERLEYKIDVLIRHDSGIGAEVNSAEEQAASRLKFLNLRCQLDKLEAQEKTEHSLREIIAKKL